MMDADLNRFREAIYSFSDLGTIGPHFLDVKMAVGYRGDFSSIEYNLGSLIIGTCGPACLIVRG